MSGKHTGTLVLGTAGSGKTSYAAALCAAMMEKRPTATMQFARARAVLRRIWNTYRDASEETEGQVVEQFTALDVLVLDDLGKEGRISDASLGAFHEIVSNRNDNRKFTILTTNLSLKEIGAAYDASLASRFGSWPEIVMAEKDLRRRGTR